MILVGFEIENWSCIKRVAIDSLPPTGVIVLHGPNGTGKSSILAALRACLMDYPTTSTKQDLKRWFPKNSIVKPRVTITFRAQGTVWRITKQFGSKESKLESRTTAGAWKVEQSTAADAHEQTRRLLGNKDSDSGLQQLLWLTQAEFRLPDPKNLDLDVQAQLRGILGVLQTPLDDRFLRRVKEEWSQWFSVRSKPGEKPKLKKDCPLAKNQALLAKHRMQLDGIEAQYRDFEAMMRRADDLEVLIRDLWRQRDEKARARDLLQTEFDQSRRRLEMHQRAVEHVATKEKALGDVKAMRQRRQDAEKELRNVEGEEQVARRDAEEKTEQLRTAEQHLRELREEIQTLTDTGRGLQARWKAANDRRQFLSLQKELEAVREKQDLADEAFNKLEDLKRQAREHAAPDAMSLKALEENQMQAGKLRAELEAAAIVLSLMPEAGAGVLRLAIDGAPAMDGAPPGDCALIRRSIRRQAEITLPGWGRAEIIRGSDKRSIDQIEYELNELDQAFAEGIAPFGLVVTDTAILDRLRRSAADKQVRDEKTERNQGDIDRLAPQGLDHLREQVAGLERKLHASEPALAPSLIEYDLPTGATGLEQLDERLTQDIEETRNRIDDLEGQVKTFERKIEGPPDADGIGLKRSSKTNESLATGLRQQEAAAKKTEAGLSATAEFSRKELKRMDTAERIDGLVFEAETASNTAQRALEDARLSESEETIRERLGAADEGLRGISGQLSEAEMKLHQIHGAMSQSEGLHQKRAAGAARVEELAAYTEREQLKSEAFDRLYALFEECREKQLGAVMGPVHDRVLRWMRLLRIGGYQKIHFNDQFLPEKLSVGDGVSEMPLDEESTGTIEQIALMVRLALGSTLSTVEEPIVAMLDDPLTHSDAVRLDRMRAVLKSASAGDAGSTPSAGPMQIMVFTCHPEWFAIDGAKIVDLSKPDVLSRNY